MILTALAALSATFLSAQLVQPVFEVVSIKPLGDFRPRSGPPRSDPGRVSYPSITLRLLVMQAYGVRNDQINGPSWIDDQFYDVEGKIPEGALPSQVPQMLQSLLAERFGLKIHQESPVKAIYALLVGKSGPKLKKSDETTPMVDPNGKQVSRRISFSTSGRIQFNGTTMTQFARSMSAFMDRPVIDMTDLPGRFDIVLDANPDDLEGLHKMFPTTAPSPGASASSSIFTAVQGLGLKLESRKLPIEHIEIDHAEMFPTGN
jgi:uncharacterized protein (TIGR03435 family)